MTAGQSIISFCISLFFHHRGANLCCTHRTFSSATDPRAVKKDMEVAKMAVFWGHGNHDLFSFCKTWHGSKSGCFITWNVDILGLSSALFCDLDT